MPARARAAATARAARDNPTPAVGAARDGCEGRDHAAGVLSRALGAGHGRVELAHGAKRLETPIAGRTVVLVDRHIDLGPGLEFQARQGISFTNHSRATDTARQMVRHFFLSLSLLALTGFGPPVISDGAYPPLRLSPEQIDAVAVLRRPPQVSASAALLYDVDAGEMLYSLRADEPLPPASTAKLMTALLSFERAGLEDVVTVSAIAAGTEGSRMELSQGEQLTVKQLLYGLLLPSGNDAAVALAEHISGDTAKFVALMNERAQSLGLTGTRFANPHGYDDPLMVSTASDLLRLTQAALRYPVFREIIATSDAEIAGHSLRNTNELLGILPGADGVKTGTTDRAGECLVASISRHGHRLIAVLLGSSERYIDARPRCSIMPRAAGTGAHWTSRSMHSHGPRRLPVNPTGCVRSPVDVFLPEPAAEARCRRCDRSSQPPSLHPRPKWGGWSGEPAAI